LLNSRNEYRFERISIKEHRKRFEEQKNKEYLELMKRHKKNQKCLAPLVFPMLEREKRHKEGLFFSEISTPKSNDPAYQDKSSSVDVVSKNSGLVTVEGFP